VGFWSKRKPTPERHLTFARVDTESSVVRWFLSRHGEALFSQAPGLLTRMAQGRADVALLFNGDTVVGLTAWSPGNDGSAEILADYATTADAADAAVTPGAFVYGPDGPLQAAGIVSVWVPANVESGAKSWLARGFKPVSGPPAAKASGSSLAGTAIPGGTATSNGVTSAGAPSRLSRQIGGTP
jgi:hypothetical protein